jgi:hypothetical protein
MATAKMAVEDAKLDLSTVNKPRFGVLMGSGIGGIDSFEKNAEVMFSKGPRRVSPFFIPMVIGNTASGVIAIELGAKVSAREMSRALGTHAHGAPPNPRRAEARGPMMQRPEDAARHAAAPSEVHHSSWLSLSGSAGLLRVPWLREGGRRQTGSSRAKEQLSAVPTALAPSPLAHAGLTGTRTP